MTSSSFSPSRTTMPSRSSPAPRLSGCPLVNRPSPPHDSFRAPASSARRRRWRRIEAFRWNAFSGFTRISGTSSVRENEAVDDFSVTRQPAAANCGEVRAPSRSCGNHAASPGIPRGIDKPRHHEARAKSRFRVRQPAPDRTRWRAGLLRIRHFSKCPRKPITSAVWPPL